MERKQLQVTNCGLCGCAELRLILDLGVQPLAEAHRSDAPRYPLRLVQCSDCDLVQLDYIAPQEEVFPPFHPYASGNAKALREHFKALADELTPGLAKNDLIVDIGCNDGTLLKSFPGRVRKVGVEPTEQGAKSGGLWYREFFTAEVARTIRDKHGPAKLILATNVLAHCPDPHDFLKGVRLLLAPDGIFVTENHDVASVLSGQWDTIYHEHARYYSPATLERLCNRNGLWVTDHQKIPTHGGSFRSYVSPWNTELQTLADDAARDLRRVLGDLKVYGIGATTRASGLVHFADIADSIEAVCEVSTSDKIGLVMPGTEIPIVDEAILFGDDQPETALLFSWHLADQIVPKLREKGYRGQIIVPLPQPKVIAYDGQLVH